jgi:hydroxymethylglutaryl-CoA lyase
MKAVEQRPSGRTRGPVEIVEVSPRDGLQNESVVLPTDAKIALIERAIAAGARRIEATSFVNPKRVPQMADADEVMARIPRRDGVSYIGLALNDRGVQRALAAECDEINYVVAATETFTERNQGMDIDTALRTFEELADTIRQAGKRASITISTAFGCPFEGEVPVGRVAEIAGRAAEAGADEVAIADTIGVGVPPDVTARVAAVRDAIGDAPLRIHLHDTRHTGIANAWAAVASGVTVLDASLGGIGGCPFAPNATGNIATEDLLYLLDRAGVEHGWNLPESLTVIPWIEEQLGKPAAGMVARAGVFPRGP